MSDELRGWARVTKCNSYQQVSYTHFTVMQTDAFSDEVIERLRLKCESLVIYLSQYRPVQ